MKAFKSSVEAANSEEFQKLDPETKSKWDKAYSFSDGNRLRFGAWKNDRIKKSNREIIEKYVKKLEEGDEEVKDWGYPERLQFWTWRSYDNGGNAFFSTPWSADNTFFFSQTDGYNKMGEKKINQIREPYTNNYLKLNGKERANTRGRFGNKTTTYKVNGQGALPRDVITIPALAGGAGMVERHFIGRGHDVDKDIRITEANDKVNDIQIKSGKIKKTSVVVSGHRTGRFEGDLDKIKEFLNSNRYDTFLIPYREEVDKLGKRFIYQIFYADSNIFKIDDG
ncbi:2843_t:CDS:2 [Racocetra fulgida]|uniref:2843_t:CDS:1 n=1 Tax=Racocetra fulgida TaxID=60492 RepID=A0A9N8YZ36_9GLOM|nr:2843_t:CDS:2 [Racocetra fulgida]